MIDQSDVYVVLNNLLGRRNLPSGTDADLKRYCQEAFNYAWRYYTWTFALKTATVAPDGDGISYLPDDFDLDGYRKINGATEARLEEVFGTTGSTDFAIQWSWAAGKYYTVPATSFTMTYQIKPPTLPEDGSKVPFPSAQVVGLGAVIYAKQGENPTRADVTQEWDEFHAELDRHAGRADKNKPRRPVNYLDRAGSYTGNVG